jgi:16S rRNA processing protein RimM
MQHLLEVALVTRPHGLKGDVVIKPITNRLDRFKVGSELYLSSGLKLTITHCQVFKKGFLVKFDGFNSINDLEQFIGATLYGPAIKQEGAYFAHELIGLKVVDQSGAEIGRIKLLQENPASDLLVLEDEKLIPMVFVKEVVENPHECYVLVDIPEGLLEL